MDEPNNKQLEIVQEIEKSTCTLYRDLSASEQILNV